MNLLRAQALAVEPPVMGEDNPILPPPAQRFQKSEHVPDPPMFSGRAKSELGLFLDQHKIKFLKNADWFPTLQSRLGYAVNRLSHSALTQIRPYINEFGIQLADLARFYQIVENVFGDPDKIATATRELDILRQGNQDFVSYFVEFQRLIAELDWNEHAQKHALFPRISEELRNVMMTKKTPKTFDDYVAKLQSLAKKIAARRAETKGMGNYQLPVTGAPFRPATMFTPAPPGPAATSPGPTNPSFMPGGLVPMDRSATNRRGPPTPEESQQRFDQNLCLFCRGNNHRIAACPF